MDADVTIIGAGVIGLAIAEKLSEKYGSSFLVEKHSTFGQETSSRNSEVIHAGIYYKKGSLKARLCIEGKNLLYDYCKKHNVPYNKCGKLIVATTEAEIPILEGIRKNAEESGVDDLVMLSREQVAELEPAIFTTGALFSPSTGIVESHSLMKQFETGSINNGCQVVYGSEVTGIRKIDGGYEISMPDSGGTSFSFTTRVLINSAGLESGRIAEMAGIKDESLRIHFCKGEYFRLRPPRNRLIGRLVYPVPHKNMEGIGIHVTIDMAGGVKLGPGVRYLESNVYDYTVDNSFQNEFYLSARKFLPFLEYDDLAPEMAGIRPKLQRPGEELRDFYIMEESRRGFPGLINLIGMESPGLTSSISIANFVSGLLDKTL
jgi:L-2-hydroxyglutarate oxidase LhgO